MYINFNLVFCNVISEDTAPTVAGANVSDTQYLLVFAGLIIITISIYGNIILKRFISDFKIAGNVISQVADGDYSYRVLNIRDKQEVNLFYNSLNRLIDRTDAYIRETQAVMEHVEQNKYYRVIMEDGMLGAYLAGSRKITKTILNIGSKVKGFNDITTRFEKNIEKMVVELGQASNELDKTAANMNDVAIETTEQANILSGKAEETSANTQTVSTATEELTSSINEISMQIELSSNKIEQTIDEIKKTEENMNVLSGSVNTISEVVALINDIANQTNLLALNATIEASRAGEAGKGFAVVANEVKALASQTSNATMEIATLVTQIKDATSGSIKSFSSVTNSVVQIEEITSSIAAAVQEQNSATGEIGRSIGVVSKSSHQVSENVKQVANGAETSMKSASGLVGAASGISTQSGTLSDEVDSFLKEVRAVI